MQPIVLQTENLAVGYGNRVLLQDLNLTLRAAAVTVLLGRNGSGKSTLIRTLAGLQPALRGNVYLNGERISYNGNHERLARQLAVSLTERPHTPFMTGYELVALGRAPYTTWTGRLTATDRRKIEQALEITRAADLRDCLIEELSDGQCQKLMIARALAQDTPLLLLDEPLAHLDLASGAALLHDLAEYAKTARKAVLISSHHIESAIHRADFLWLIDADNRVHADLPEQLILDNRIGDVFSGTYVFFDQAAGCFRFPPPQVGRHIAVCLHVSEASAYWLHRAFAKRGIGLRPEENAACQIREVSNRPCRYRLQIGTNTFETDLAGIINTVLDFFPLPSLSDF